MRVTESMRTDRVRDLGPRDVVAVPIDATVRDAVATMRAKRAGAVLVLRGEHLVGIFTERDLVRKVLATRRSPAEVPVREVMTEKPATLRPNDLAGTALNLFSRGGFRHIPVVDDKGRPTGILSVKCMITHLVELYPDAVLNLPPEPGRISTDLDGG